MSPQTIDLVYLVSAALFIFSLKWMSDPKTARNGVFAGVAAMALAVVGTLLRPDIASYTWIFIAIVLGTIVGVPLSWVPLTAVPQRTALSHAFGGLAAGLVGIGKYYLFLHDGDLTALPHRCDRVRGRARADHLHRQPDGRRQAAGGAADAAGDLSGPELRQLLADRRSAC